QVNGSVVFRGGIAGADERRVPEERLVANRLANSHEILHHDAPGTKVEVSDFTVAHLSVGQADGAPRRIEQRSRIASGQRVPRRRGREGNGVSVSLGAI